MKRQMVKNSFFNLLVATTIIFAAAIIQVSAQKKVNFVSKYGTICMDVKGGIGLDRELIAYSCQDSTNQRFYYNNNTQQIYVNDPTKDFTCLTGKGGAVKTDRCGDALAEQKWRFLTLNDGSFFIEHIQSGKVIDIEGAVPLISEMNKGKRLILYNRKSWGNDNQRWFIGDPKSSGDNSVSGKARRQPGEISVTQNGQVISTSSTGVVALGGANIVALGGGNIVALGGGN